MSVYRPTKKCPATGRRIPKTRIYQADVILDGPDGRSHRVRRSTGQTTKTAAQRVVAKWRQDAPLGNLEWLMPEDRAGLTLGEVCQLYWEEVGQHQRSAKDIITNLEHCQRLIGPATLFTAIDGRKIAEAARTRAAEPSGRGEGQLVSLATVNRQIIDMMSRLHTRARKVWKPKGLPLDIDWTSLKYDEGEGRDRTLSDEEREIFWREVRPDYVPILWFNFNRGRRLCEMNPLRRHIDIEAGTITVRIAKRNGKHRVETMDLDADELAVIRREWGRAPGERLFHYQVQRGREKGMWRPVTYEGLKTYLHRLLNRLRKDYPGRFEDLRPHDFRHDFASRLLRDCGNLKWVQDALMHRDIQSTMRYAHLLSKRDVTDAIARVRQGGMPKGVDEDRDEESRIG